MTTERRPLALVTGASQGIGAAVARLLAPRYDLLLGGRDTGRLEAVASEIRTGPADVRPWPVDLTDGAALARAAEGIDRLDVLVHSAGVGLIGTIAETPAATWREEFELNVVAVAELTRLLLPALRATGESDVVLVNSGAGLNARPGWGPYAASKFALRAFGDALRAEEAGHGVRVTSVHPGRVDTPMQERIVAGEGRGYDPSEFLRPESVGAAVLAALTAGRDAHLTEIVLRPGG